MGRVRRYKTIKACDPFSKKKAKVTLDTKHDDPPEKWESKNRKKQRRLAKRETSVDDIDFFDEKVVERLAAETDKANKGQITKAPGIEPMRKGETLQMFQNRVKKMTRQALIQEIPKLRKSAIRRKEKMKEMKQKKKDSAKRHIDPEDEYKPQRYTAVSFGERVTEPPKLQDFVQSLTKAAQKAKAKALLKTQGPSHSNRSAVHEFS